MQGTRNHKQARSPKDPNKRKERDESPRQSDRVPRKFNREEKGQGREKRRVRTDMLTEMGKAVSFCFSKIYLS